MSGAVAESAGATAEATVEPTVGEGAVGFALVRRRLFVRLPGGVAESDGATAREGVVGFRRRLFAFFFIVFSASISGVVLHFAVGHRFLLERRTIHKATA